MKYSKIYWNYILVFLTDPIFGTNILCKINPTNPGCGGGGGKKGNGGGNGGENGGDNGGGGKY